MMKMPDILFEGKRKDNGEWIEGSLLNFRENTYIIPHDSEYCYDDTEKLAFDIEYFEVIPETVGQYTGLTDKNGKLIFKGDIVKAKWSSLNIINTVVGTVKYENATFVLETDEHYLFFEDNIFSIDCEVIGNIHDNPELLKQED